MRILKDGRIELSVKEVLGKLDSAVKTYGIKKEGEYIIFYEKDFAGEWGTCRDIPVKLVRVAHDFLMGAKK